MSSQFTIGLRGDHKPSGRVMQPPGGRSSIFMGDDNMNGHQSPARNRYPPPPPPSQDVMYPADNNCPQGKSSSRMESSVFGPPIELARKESHQPRSTYNVITGEDELPDVERSRPAVKPAPFATEDQAANSDSRKQKRQPPGGFCSGIF